MVKIVKKYSEIKDKIIRAVDTITDPIRQTLGPMGGNVIYEDSNGNQFYTNDGVTIAKNIFLKDPFENAIVEIIKGSSLKTNQEAGDGTSSTILLSSILIKEGLRLVEEGANQMIVKRHYDDFADKMTKTLTGMATKVKTDDELRYIAKVSANNDGAIADDIVRVVKVAGLDGQVLIEQNYSPDTEIIEDTGFVSKGMFTPELGDKKNFVAKYNDVPVLITDKRLYYKQEAETILAKVLEYGYNELVIVASDFIGESLSYFVANHQRGQVRVMLIQEKDRSILEDLATYLGGEVVSDKKGSIVDKLSISDFNMAKMVFSNAHKSIISRDKKDPTKGIDTRVKALKAEMKKIGNEGNPEYKKIQSRVAALTNGMVTIRVGGRTPIEIVEKCHRYEDAVNATRAAMKSGYLPGGGLAYYHAFKKIKVDKDYERIFRKVTQANIRQVADNAGANPDVILLDVSSSKSESLGYNAREDVVEDLLKAGIIEPLLVVSQVIANAVSIANVIVTSRYMIVNDIEELKERNKK